MTYWNGTNSANLSDTLLNQADIWTLYDRNEDDNHAEAEVHVGEGEPDLYVDKHPEPGDPAQGQTMLWEINYGNNGPVASGSVVLTDTLPEDTSIVSWSSEQGYGLWTNHSTAEQLILEAPTIPGHWGDRIYLRLLVDAPAGTQLTNTVEISSAHSYAWEMRNDVWVGDPRWDSFLYKNFEWGQLVPGGEVAYDFHFRNGGNMATQTWLTDTLPAGTSFVDSWLWTGSQSIPFPPDYVDDEIVVWDLGVMQPGQPYNLSLRLDLDGSLSSGTVFTNCAELVTDGDEDRLYDNYDCVVDTIREPGPNLRVYKNYEWENKGRLRYDIYVENIGTQRLGDFLITDTYPLNTTFNGDWHMGHGPNFDLITDDPGNRQIVFQADEGLDPGNTARIRFYVDLDGGIIGEQGLCFGNYVEAPIDGDVWPDDNYDEVTACTGPDVYVEKWLSGGEPRPGEILTFTIEFGNQNRGSWDGDDQYGSHITETLPTGMTFITATVPGDPNQPWHPELVDGNTIVWGFGTMWANHLWQFDLVVQLTDTLESGDLLLNTVEAYGDSPDDVEPDWDNNVYELEITIPYDDYYFYLPIIFKQYTP